MLLVVRRVLCVVCCVALCGACVDVLCVVFNCGFSLAAASCRLLFVVWCSLLVVVERFCSCVSVVVYIVVFLV